uniref:Uncharacterized protein n=1 Tax=Opuntia streptacantha TaxID=393608 RepID=A0A7C9D7H3_OPUST
MKELPLLQPGLDQMMLSYHWTLHNFSCQMIPNQPVVRSLQPGPCSEQQILSFGWIAQKPVCPLGSLVLGVVHQPLKIWHHINSLLMLTHFCLHSANHQTQWDPQRVLSRSCQPWEHWPQ